MVVVDTTNGVRSHVPLPTPLLTSPPRRDTTRMGAPARRDTTRMGADTTRMGAPGRACCTAPDREWRRSGGGGGVGERTSTCDTASARVSNCSISSSTLGMELFAAGPAEESPLRMAWWMPVCVVSPQVRRPAPCVCMYVPRHCTRASSKCAPPALFVFWPPTLASRAPGHPFRAAACSHATAALRCAAARSQSRSGCWQGVTDSARATPRRASQHSRLARGWAMKPWTARALLPEHEAQVVESRRCAQWHWQHPVPGVPVERT